MLAAGVCQRVRTMWPISVHAMSITPFVSDGAIDEHAFRAHLRFLAGAGVGVYVASQGSGEGDLLTVHERIALYRIAVDEVGASTPVVAAGIGLAGSTAVLRDLAAAAAATGVHAVQVLGPKPGPLPMRADEIETYFRTILDAVPCDVHLASNRVLTGSALAVELVRALVAEYSQAKVVNLTNPDPGELLDAVDRLAPQVEVRVGITRQLGDAAARGASGLLSFEANVAPDLVVRACATGDLEPLLMLNAALSKGGNPRSLKAALALLGRNGGALRPPYLPLTAEQMTELAEYLGRARI